MGTDVKTRILKTSSKLFYKQGYHATSLRQIADECGMQIGNLYYYYKKKSDLIAFFNTDLFAEYVRRLQERYGDEIHSFSGLVTAEYTFLYYFASDKKNCRIYAEASEVQELRDDYIQVHHDVMMELIPQDELAIGAREAFMVSNYACAGDIQLMNYYYKHFSSVDFEDIFLPGLKHRLIMLGLTKEEAQGRLDAGASLARQVRKEGRVQISLWGT